MDDIKWVLILVVVQFLIGIFNSYMVTKEDIGMERLAKEVAIQDSVIANLQTQKDSLAIENKGTKRALVELINYRRGLNERLDNSIVDIETVLADTTVDVNEYLRYLSNGN